jgi:Fungal Zn(2)-Cys(6) binuclear cluster domain
MTPSSEEKGGLSRRSCIRCSQKKLRCDRKNPCGRCLKTGDECVHPADKRVPRKLNRPPISDILVHLKQLEEEVERLKSRSAKQPLGADSHSISGYDLRTESNSHTNAERVDTPSGRLVTRDGRSRYVGDEASVVLGDKACSVSSARINIANYM